MVGYVINGWGARPIMHPFLLPIETKERISWSQHEFFPLHPTKLDSPLSNTDMLVTTSQMTMLHTKISWRPRTSLTIKQTHAFKLVGNNNLGPEDNIGQWLPWDHGKSVFIEAVISYKSKFSATAVRHVIYILRKQKTELSSQFWRKPRSIASVSWEIE